MNSEMAIYSKEAAQRQVVGRNLPDFSNVVITDPEVSQQAVTYRKLKPRDIYEELNIKRGEDGVAQWKRVNRKLMSLRVELDKVNLKMGLILTEDRAAELKEMGIDLSRIRRDYDQRRLDIRKDELKRQIETCRNELARLRPWVVVRRLDAEKAVQQNPVAARGSRGNLDKVARTGTDG